MQKETFKEIDEKLDTLINQCNSIKTKIKEVRGFENLTIKVFNSLVGKAKTLQTKMDKIFTAELYHVIGMAGMDAIQTQQFCSKIKKLGSHRYLIKCLSFMNFAQFTDNSDKSKYSCEVLGVTLSGKNNQKS